MSKEFKVGDIVKLKSGGPDMTVTGVQLTTMYIECIYFYINYLTPIKELFVPETLELVKTQGE